MKVYVKTPARLHLGLIDLNGDLGRLFGGLGVAIDHPNVILQAEKAQTLTVKGEKAELTRKFASQFLDAYGVSGKVALNVGQVIPEHIGLGSGTQLALAVATSISRLFNVEGSTHEFAFAMGRTAAVRRRHRSVCAGRLGCGCGKKHAGRRQEDYTAY